MTYLCLMKFPSIINWTNPFQIKGLLDINLHFFFKFSKQIMYVKSAELDQTPRSVASCLVLHCLTNPHKMTAMLM